MSKKKGGRVTPKTEINLQQHAPVIGLCPPGDWNVWEAWYRKMGANPVHIPRSRRTA